ncbi:glycosyltransferase [Burkholderia metallica]|uniref:glycosyltransferase n=1 Tax=Burkholderia metallica TaxID=488729 RepID=UPI0015761177|nr:glycosyltransferase [Burkholderia metallica]NTZ08819.1 glycosyltransferase [Burkholderia metallica]
MRIVIDMQGAQTGSRFRGIGRYTLALAKAMVRNKGEHEIVLALSGLFPETIEPIRNEFSGLLPDSNIRVWSAASPVRELESENRLRREIAERVREAFLADLRPDVVLITSLFEGLGDDAIGSVGVLNDNIPTAVILYDLIPLINPDEHFRNSKLHQTWYNRKIASLNRSRKLLAISESARREALDALDFAERDVVNISGACDESFRILPLSGVEKREFLTSMGIRNSFVMYTGGADERKNLHRLIAAYAKLPGRIRQTHQLVFAGKMPEGNVQEYRRTALSNGLSESELLFTGYIADDDLLKLYNTCSLFVFPSLHEGFGLPPLEAMACGAPAIAANATSLPEVIGMKDALFDPESVDSISAKIKLALSDKKFRNRLLAHGKAQYRKFSWDDSARRALSALRDFSRSHGVPTSPNLSVEKTSIFENRQLKILAIKLDHLGDFILAIPAFAKLRARYPNARIEVVTGSWNTPIADQIGVFDKIHTYDYFKRKSSELPSITEEKLDTLLKSLPRYDIAIDLRRQRDARFLLARVKAGVKVGYETTDTDIDGRLDVAIRTFPDIPSRASVLNKTSISKQMITVVDSIPDDINDYISLPDLRRGIRPNSGHVAIFPKAGNDAREWGAPNYESLVRQLLTHPLLKRINLYFANAAEADEFGFPADDRVAIHLGLNFDDLTTSLSENAVCVANNSGGAHLASYLGLIVIGIYSGHELSAEWAPQFHQSFVIHREAQCAPCHGAKRTDCEYSLFCLNDIRVSDVGNQVVEALENFDTLATAPNELRISPIAIQRSSVAIVDELVASLAPLIPPGGDTDLANIATYIAHNHPDYAPPPSIDFVYPNKPVDHHSILVDWHGFSDAEALFRWTNGRHSNLTFECAETMPESGVLTLLFDTLGAQRVTLALNGVPVFEGVQEGAHLELRLPVSNLRVGKNQLSIALPDAKQPGNGDERYLALAVRGLCIETAHDVMATA